LEKYLLKNPSLNKGKNNQHNDMKMLILIIKKTTIQCKAKMCEYTKKKAHQNICEYIKKLGKIKHYEYNKKKIKKEKNC